LGIIQGLTEFLPVSSSGHLVLAQQILGVKQSGVAFELSAHLGTLLSVLVYFRRRLSKIALSLFNRDAVDDRRLMWLLVLSMIPAGLAGFFLEEFFETAFSSPAVTSAMLLITGMILLATKLTRARTEEVKVRSTLAMGFGQAAAIMPGISRSGATIAAGMAAGLKPSVAAEFSFLMAVPVIAGAAVFKANEFLENGAISAGCHIVGAAVSFLFGLLAVYAVLAAVRRGRFEWFAYYCFAAGGVGLYLFL
jgi:undecaprenyl-diphosphatase